MKNKKVMACILIYKCGINVIKDPSLLVPTPLKDLKNQKGFFKVICKRDKELESLSKKHEKVGLVFIQCLCILHVHPCKTQSLGAVTSV